MQRSVSNSKRFNFHCSSKRRRRTMISRRQSMNYERLFPMERIQNLKRNRPRKYSANRILHDYSTNEGKVVGVWIFIRHGDRAPARPLSAPHRVKEESLFWLDRLPTPDLKTVFREYSRFFPPDIHPSNNNGHFLDVRRFPFGFLTQRGLQQTRENGARLFNRYDRHGLHLPEMEHYDCSKDFLDVWDVKVFSTNYLRTVLSVQSFLDGLLGTRIFASIRDNSATTKLETGVEIPHHGDVPDLVDGKALLHVQVRGRDDDTLNAFDRDPDKMTALVSDVMSHPEFQSRDGLQAPLAARLANILPGLARKKRNTTGFNASPSGINWIEATDHFVCRTAHHVAFSRFSDFEHDIQVEETLRALSHQTTAHLAWRFRQWYKNPKLLAAIASPPLREILDQLLTATTMGVRERHPFTIYSCHDVTLLAILYGIGAEFLSNDHKGGWRFWPKYASSLIFELVQVDGGSHVVRILLNGKPVTSVDRLDRFWDAHPSRSMGHGPDGMLLASDFKDIVTSLEAESTRNEKAESCSTQRDMSNWTG